MECGGKPVGATTGSRSFRAGHCVHSALCGARCWRSKHGVWCLWYAEAGALSTLNTQHVFLSLARVEMVQASFLMWQQHGSHVAASDMLSACKLIWHALL